MAESSTENYKPVVENVKLEDETEIPVFVKDDQITNNEAVLQQHSKKSKKKLKRSMLSSSLPSLPSDSGIPQTAERSPASRALTSASIRQRTVDSDSASSAENDALSALQRSKKLKPTPENFAIEGDSDIPQAAERSPASRALTSAGVRQRTVDSDSTGASSAENDALSALQRSKKLKPTPENFVIEERSALLIKASRYQEAIFLLEDCLPTERQQALLFLCYFKQENMKAKRCIDVLRELMTSSSPPPKPENVFELVTLCMSDHHEFIDALIFSSCSCKLYSLCCDPKEALRGIKFCCAKIDLCLARVFNKGLTTPMFASEVGVKILKAMIADLRSLDLKDKDEEDKRVKIEAFCFLCCGYLLFKENKRGNSVRLVKTGINLMQERFGQRTEDCGVYEHLLNNIGSTFEGVGNYKEAATWYEKAKKAKKSAREDRNDKLKQ